MSTRPEGFWTLDKILLRCANASSKVFAFGCDRHCDHHCDPPLSIGHHGMIVLLMQI